MVNSRLMHSYRILVSDDDEACREAVREALEPIGYDTDLAASGHEAIELIRRRLVHLVIVDMNMPDMTGLETVTIIRKEIVTPLPSILMSADGSCDLAARAQQANFEEFLPKPLDICELRRTVEQVIRRYYEDC